MSEADNTKAAAAAAGAAADAGAQTSDALDDRGTDATGGVALLRRLRDVDTAEDLRALREAAAVAGRAARVPGRRAVRRG